MRPTPDIDTPTLQDILDRDTRIAELELALARAEGQLFPRARDIQRFMGTAPSSATATATN